MRLLVTGASGFVGKAFIASLSPDDEVVCLGRSLIKDHGNVTYVMVDIANPDAVNEAAERIKGNFDVLVHLAAYVPRTAGDDELQQANKVNVDGTINLIKAFEGRVRKIVIGSTAEVYDQSKIKDIITEETPVGPASYYGATKLASELIAQTYSKKTSTPVTVLRFSVMYGPDDPISRALPNFIKLALKDEPITIVNGQAKRDYIHIDDVVASIHKAVQSAASGVFNIGSGKAVSVVDAAQTIIKKSQSKSTINVTSGNAGVDIVIDPKNAVQHLDFKASVFFPDKLDEMIASYR